MRCFRHTERDAVGNRKHCQHGLCSECAALVGGVLACRDLHEQQVADLMLLIERDTVQAGRVRSGYVRNGIFSGLVGVIFAVLGWSQLRFLGPQAVFLIVLGSLLLNAAVANLL